MEQHAFMSFAWWSIFLGGISTVAIFSFLYRENPFYRFFEHLYIGIATGISIMASVRYFLWPQVLKPLLYLDQMPFPDGTYAEPYNKGYLLFLLPMAFGSLYYCILSRRLSWLAQLVIGFSLGVGGGLAFKATFNEMLPQLQDSFRPLIVPTATGDATPDALSYWTGALNWTTFSNTIFTITLLSALSYFFFTFKRSRGGVVERSSQLGRWMMMVCFGAFFGSTIMARMALLVERLNFMIEQWWPNFTGIMT